LHLHKNGIPSVSACDVPEEENKIAENRAELLKQIMRDYLNESPEKGSGFITDLLSTEKQRMENEQAPLSCDSDAVGGGYCAPNGYHDVAAQSSAVPLK
jgi:hypothetical protein